MALLEASGIGKNFGETKVLKDISLTLEQGEALAIIGSSGSGKTTLLRCLNFLERPDTGVIRVNGETMWDAADPATQRESEVRKKRLHFGLVFQNFNLFPQYTALENVMLAGELLAKEQPDYKANKKAIHAQLEAQARDLLAQMGLSERAGHYPHQLSGGQQQRVAIARALALHPDILCFDEPTSALDPELTGEVLRVLRDLADRKTTMIIVTHEMHFARDVADRILFMDGGVVVEEGPARQLIDHRMTELLEQRNNSLEKSLSDLNRERTFMSVLCTDYISVYCVDLQNDSLEPLKLDPAANAAHIHDIKAGKTFCYSELIGQYYEKYVIKESAPDFTEILSAEHIQNHLAAHPKLSYRYRVTPNAAGQENFEAEIFPFSAASSSRVLIGFKQIDELVSFEQNSRRQLQEALDEANLNNEIISAISKIYFSIYRIDLTQDMYEEVSSDNKVHRLTGRMGRASSKMKELCHRFVVPEYQDKILDFFDLSTIAERLHTDETIAMDYLANDGNWHSARFIVKKRDALGNVTNILYVTRLISEQKRREQSWMLLAEEANKANEAKSEFLSKMAHDIRTPLNAVMGFADIAKRSLGDPSKIDDCLGKLRTSGAYIEQLVSNILDITNLENGRQQLKPCETSVSELCHTLNMVFDQALMNDGLNITFNCHDIYHDYILADGLKLKQIYSNLLSNSIKFTPGHGDVGFELYEENIPGSDKIRLVARISDTGIGIKPEYQASMFNKFSRETDTRISKVRGSGLGLAIVKELVDLMQGTITVQSNPGGGTIIEVSIDVPYIIKDDLWSGQSGDSSDAESLCVGMHLLVAEDNELNYEVVSELLGMNGISCERAEDGSVCVAMFSTSAAGTYDGILMDLQMPVMDGISASYAIRKLEHPDAQNIPIIAITANTFAKDLERCRLAGMNEHLSKPLNIRQLISILSKFKK